ncbi:MAG: bifunctional precorrin-2 dehydrogenase/sirohydrochlorin ferrochelatase, partial [Acidimicrobiales bacterium]
MPVRTAQYPVNLMIEGRRCLVVGGGTVAAHKAAGLVACGARVHVVAIEVSAAMTALAGPSIEKRPYRRGEVGEYRLGVAATGDAMVNAAVLADGEEAGVWVNAADDVDNCSFTLPAVVRRGPVVVAVSTGGHSPALARWLKERVAESIGPEYEVLAGLLSAERDAIRSSGRSTEGL